MKILLVTFLVMSARQRVHSFFAHRLRLLEIGSPLNESKSPTLFTYQEEGVKFLINERRLILADEPGLGKTIQSISALNHLISEGLISPTEFRILIICPKTVVGVWTYELSRWLTANELKTTSYLHIVMAGKNEPLRHSDSRGKIQIINYDICDCFKTVLQENDYDVVICDEAHYLKSFESKRTKAILGGKDRGIKSTYLWLLTGTPIVNREKDFLPLLWAVVGEKFDSYDVFLEDMGYSILNALNLKELKRYLGTKMLRRRKESVMHDLPPKVHCVVPLETDEAVVKREQDEILTVFGKSRNAKEFTKSCFDAKSMKSFAENSSCINDYGVWSDPEFGMLKSLAIIRRNTALLKLAPAVTVLNELINMEKIVVFAHHRELIFQLVNSFGEKCSFIVGGMKTEDRVEAITRFQTDDSCRVFIGSMRAAGVGISLTASSHVIFLELDYSPSIMSQAEDRCHRPGQQNALKIDYLVFKDSIDEWIAQLLVRKNQNIENILSNKCSTGASPHTSPAFIMGFGKYRGKALEEIPTNYIKNFLIKQEVYRENDELLDALYRSDFILQKPAGIRESNFENNSKVMYKFNFGKYQDQNWDDAPASYRQWIFKEKIWMQPRYHCLWSALFKSGLILDNPPTNTTHDVK